MAKRIFFVPSESVPMQLNDAYVLRKTMGNPRGTLVSSLHKLRTMYHFLGCTPTRIVMNAKIHEQERNERNTS